MIRIDFIVVGLAVAISAGCWSQQEIIRNMENDAGGDTDTDSDSDIADCAQGEYSGAFTIDMQSDVAVLAGYTSISGNLRIDCPSCTDLSELICLTSVGGDLWIYDSDALTNLEGLRGITSEGGR